MIGYFNINEEELKAFRKIMKKEQEEAKTPELNTSGTLTGRITPFSVNYLKYNVPQSGNALPFTVVKWSCTELVPSGSIEVFYRLEYTDYGDLVLYRNGLDESGYDRVVESFASMFGIPCHIEVETSPTVN